MFVKLRRNRAVAIGDNYRAILLGKAGFKNVLSPFFKK
jgi:hypothetical protein